MLSAINQTSMLSGIMLNVYMLIAIMPSVVAPFFIHSRRSTKGLHYKTLTLVNTAVWEASAFAAASCFHPSLMFSGKIGDIHY
jgi:hypothetical protein